MQVQHASNPEGTISPFQVSDLAHAIPFSLGGRKITAYSPNEANVSMVLCNYALIVDDVIRNIKRSALEKIDPSFMHLFRLKADSLIKSYAEELKEGYKTGNSGQILELEALTGVSHTKFPLCAALAEKIAFDFFNKDNPYNTFFDREKYPLNINSEGTQVGQPVFFYHTPSEEIENWEMTATLEMSNYAYHSLGLKQSEHEVSFSEEELETYKIKRGINIVDPTKMSCLAFALLQSNRFLPSVSGLKMQGDIIFHDSWGDRPLNNLFRFLKRWNYSSVETPQAGDLVVYLANEKPTHVGVYTQTGKVSSKLGRANPYSHEHKLFDIPPHYGTKVIFFRMEVA